MRILGIAFAAALMLPMGQAHACQQLPIVYFWGGSVAINEDARAALRDFAHQARGRLDRIALIRVVGHSDRTGSRRARQLISLRRARAVRDALVAEGLPARRIAVFGASDTQPAVTSEENVREPQNRRVELQITFAEAARTVAEAHSSTPSSNDSWRAVCG